MENVTADPVTEATAMDEEDREFYENLEAPMYVDFSAPDLAAADDGSWFCLKIGCDQNHEQINPEAVDKSFMLRVMAARSPNVRLHKAIKRSNGRLNNAHCPHSAPAKQPRSRLHRLSTATAVPDKFAISKLKNHPISNLKSPQNQTKKMVLKAIEEKDTISTPKIQEMHCKNQSVSEGKNESAFFSAKPVFSYSSKKEIKQVCANIRKLNLNLNNGKRRSVPSRYLGKVSKPAKRCDQSNNNTNDLNIIREAEIAPGKKREQETLKEKVKKLGSDGIKRDQNSESDPQKECLRHRRKLTLATRKASVEKATELVVKLESKGNSGAINNNTNERQKLEMGAKRKGSRPLWKPNQPILKFRGNSGTKDEKVEKDGLRTELQNCDNVISGAKNEKVVRKMGLKSKARHNSETRIQKDELIITEAGNGDDENCDNINTGTKDEKVVRKVGLRSKVRQKDELVTEMDGCDEDKENIMHNGSKRAEVRKNSKIEGKRTSLLRTIENVPPQQVLKPQKNKKTTNPKPFRFRTDERGILKEANMEKKKLVQSEPPKDESKNNNILGKETGVRRCKGRIVPSKYNCMIKGPTSLESKRKNPSICGKEQQELMGNANLIRDGIKR